MSFMEHHLIIDNSVLKHYDLPLITENSYNRLVCQFVSKSMLIGQSGTFNFCSHFLHCDLSL